MKCYFTLCLLRPHIKRLEEVLSHALFLPIEAAARCIRLRSQYCKKGMNASAGKTE